MTTQEKLSGLRSLMHEKGFSAYIIPPADPHQSEYTPEYWKTRQWISGFTGSAGTVVVTHNFAGLWTDSRYFLQAEKELDGSGIELVKLKIPHTPEYIDWICENLPAGSVVGIDGKVFSQALVNLMKNRFAEQSLKANCAFDLPGQLWQDRPPLPANPVYEHSLAFAGKSRELKLQELRGEMAARQIDYHLVTSLDDIAWLFNLRGNDADYNPVFEAYALIGIHQATLFIRPEKLTDEIAGMLREAGIKTEHYNAFGSALTGIGAGKRVLYSAGRTSHHVFLGLPSHCIRIDSTSIVAELKSRKTSEELGHIKNAMVKDGIALVKFFRWLEKNLGKTTITEVTVDEVLTGFRKEQPGFVGCSFSTIAGYKDHGAIVHYLANEESAHQLHPEGLLLVDSGGQYTDGTTDITRTISLGKPTEGEVIDYTLVLRGLIRLSMVQFPEGTKGFQLDAMARCPMWQQGKNYGHGTGHGVGYFLNVHEGPQGISPNAAINVALQEGMVQSNEPGIYVAGKYGIRLENIIVVKQHMETTAGKFFRFETLTLYPFEKNLMDMDMLTPEEIVWLNDYHALVYKSLSPHLSREENQWLLEKTKAISIA